MDELDDLKRRVIFKKLGIIYPEVKQMDESPIRELDNLNMRVNRIEKILDLILDDDHIYKAIGFNASEELKRLKSDLRRDLWGEEV